MIPGLNLHHPSLLYAYLALLTQCGLLQLLGCIGALKLNERLLNAYWLLLLFLLCGDAMLGIVWIFRFDTLYTKLEPILKQRLRAEYGLDPEFTATWDQLQGDHMCCGVEGPQDYQDFPNRTHLGTVPVSCCRALKEEKEEERIDVEIDVERKEVEEKPTTTIKQRLLNKKHREQRSLATRLLMETCASVNGTTNVSKHYDTGCKQKLRQWLSDAAHILGVVGYCVLAFLKVCFLGILRYEIREMVQKIKILQLQSEQTPPVLLLSEPDTSVIMCNHTDTAHHIDAVPTRVQRLFANDTGNDSDTNSHCALLLESLPGASNETHELQELYVRTAQI